MKKSIIYIIALLGMAAMFPSCLESDDFDGLTDSRPEVAIEFPGRQYDQEVGLGFIATGFDNSPSITYTLQLEGGGDVGISSIVSVEGRAAIADEGDRDLDVTICPSFEQIEEDINVGGARSFEYTRTYDFLSTSAALCSQDLRIPDVYYELIFTIELTNGEQLVSMWVRGIFKE